MCAELAACRQLLNLFLRFPTVIALMDGSPAAVVVPLKQPQHKNILAISVSKSNRETKDLTNCSPRREHLLARETSGSIRLLPAILAGLAGLRSKL